MRNPNVSDGEKIWELVSESQPLDLNSSYLYLLLCRHFSKTCFVAEDETGLQGFLSSYVPPETQDVIFVWQVAVRRGARGDGLARSLLHRLVEESACYGIRYIEASITPSNKASNSLFRSFAGELNADFNEKTFFPAELFPKSENHEEELLVQIGPIGQKTNPRGD
ncbi:MAG: diaminobutyrate acetyltransferase [Thermoleophilia bacterium]